MNVMNVISTLDLDSRPLTGHVWFSSCFSPNTSRRHHDLWRPRQYMARRVRLGNVIQAIHNVCTAHDMRSLLTPSKEKRCDTALCWQPESIKDNAGNGFIGLFQPPAESKTSNQQAKAKRGPTWKKKWTKWTEHSGHSHNSARHMLDHFSNKNSGFKIQYFSKGILQTYLTYVLPLRLSNLPFSTG